MPMCYNYIQCVVTHFLLKNIDNEVESTYNRMCDKSVMLCYNTKNVFT